MTKLTKDKWEKRKEKFGKILAFLPILTSPRGKKIPCSMECGRMVARSIGICRACRRKGVLKVARQEYKARRRGGEDA